MTSLKKLFKNHSLNTVCQSAKCPNIGECFSRGVATFLIAGDICTRNCSFCAIRKGQPLPLDTGEPARVAENIRNLGIRYAVITSVTRDDLPDGGAGHFFNTVKAIRRLNPKTRIEILVPDFGGKRESLETAISCKPDVLAHNIETVPRLYSEVRKGANYFHSLELLSWAKCNKMTTKSGLMLGLGETEDEIIAVMDDLSNIGCDILTFGQYLAPSKNHFSVKSCVSQKTFDKFKNIALKKGFKRCLSGTYVRSSYLAEEIFYPKARAEEMPGVYGV